MIYVPVFLCETIALGTTAFLCCCFLFDFCQMNCIDILRVSLPRNSSTNSMELLIVNYCEILLIKFCNFVKTNWVVMLT